MTGRIKSSKKYISVSFVIVHLSAVNSIYIGSKISCFTVSSTSKTPLRLATLHAELVLSLIGLKESPQIHDSSSNYDSGPTKSFVRSMTSLSPLREYFKATISIFESSAALRSQTLTKIPRLNLSGFKEKDQRLSWSVVFVN